MSSCLSLGKRDWTCFALVSSRACFPMISNTARTSFPRLSCDLVRRDGCASIPGGAGCLRVSHVPILRRGRIRVVGRSPWAVLGRQRDTLADASSPPDEPQQGVIETAPSRRWDTLGLPRIENGMRTPSFNSTAHSHRLTLIPHAPLLSFPGDRQASLGDELEEEEERGEEQAGRTNGKG